VAAINNSSFLSTTRNPWEKSRILYERIDGMRNVSVVLGGQIGSEGKGKIAGYLALKDDFDFAISNFYPNAGHTWREGEEKVVVHQLPIGLVNQRTQLLIGPGSTISLYKFFSEILKYELNYKVSQRLNIHPRAAVVLEKHIDVEKAANLARIASTLTGGAGASSQKIMRSQDACLARDIDELKEFIKMPTEEVLIKAIAEEKKILVEGAQGFELDINYGYEYPCCTSRQTNVMQVLADSGIPYNAVDRVYAVLRTFPIRVGDRPEGSSGGWEARETSWAEIEEKSGWSKGEIEKVEITTTTKRNRRVFEFDYKRLKRMVAINRPTDLCLNHVDYLDRKDHGVIKFSNLSGITRAMIERIEDEAQIPVSLIGTGPNNHDIIDRR
jgi:adenylosuccinate synthase